MGETVMLNSKMKSSKNKNFLCRLTLVLGVLSVIYMFNACASRFSAIGGSAPNSTTSSSTSPSAQKPSASCPIASNLVDGCANAPAGTPQFPNLLDIQKVVMLNIIPGSGYVNGIYSWSTSGGGGSGATGTVTVSGGKVGGSGGQLYSISNEGAGYSSRPTIIVAGLSGGSGASIVSSVYQATPHNATTPWNMPGVDYYVGVPYGTALKDPTISSNLPTGASFSGTTVSITGCNVTLDGFDFTLHNTNVVVNVSSSSCATTIEDSRFQANGLSLQPIANLKNLGPGGSFVFERNEYNGLAPVGGSGSGFAVNDPIQGSGKVILLYNFFHNFDSKVIQMNGTVAGSSLTEEYNLFADFGSCSTSSGCAHGEAEYTYGGGALTVTIQFNTYINHFHTNAADLTSPQAVQADSLNITSATDNHNVVLAPGPQLSCNESNQVGYTAAAAIYDGQQEGGTISNGVFQYDYIDASGVYFPWYHNGGTNMSYSNNIDAGTGGPCNCTTISGNGSCN